MSDELSLLARLVVGGVFLAAGTAKASRRGRARFDAALRGFRIPRALIQATATWLPRFEIVLGALLVAGLAVRPASLVSLALLLAFSALIARAVLRHEDVDCGCFGSASAEPVGIASLVRNAALASLALISAGEARMTAPFGPLERTLPVILSAAGVLAGSLLLASARLSRARSRGIGTERGAAG